MFLRVWPLLCLLLAPVATAETLRIGFGTHKPPYVFENEPRGLEYELVIAALRAADYATQAHYAPMERLHMALRREELDGIATTNERSGITAHYSDTYIYYHNVAMALTSRGFRINGLAELGRYSISSFQRARYLLGPEFQAAVEGNPRYREEALQINRNRLLYSGRVDLVIGDPRILRYFNREVADQVDTHQPLTLYMLFPPTPYSVGFREPAMRDRFNRGLQSIRDSGEYLRIEQRYADYR